MQHAPIRQGAPVLAPAAPAPLPWAQDQDGGKNNDQAKDQQHMLKLARLTRNFKPSAGLYCRAAQESEARLRV